MNVPLSLLLGLWGRIQVYVLAAGAAAGIALAAYAKIRADAKKDAQIEQDRARQRLQEKYDAIDKKPVDVDAAYDRLDRMSDDGNGRR